MSTAVRPAQIPLRTSRPAPETGPTLKALRPPPSRTRRPRLAYGLIAVVGAILIAALQMTVSMFITSGVYEADALTRAEAELQWQSQILQDEVAGLNSPQYLAANATALGMVVGSPPSYLRLSDGAILGSTTASESASALDALGNGAVPNELLAGTPLVTAPEAAASAGAAAPGSDQAQDPAQAPAEDAAVVNTPPVISDGIPTPITH